MTALAAWPYPRWVAHRGAGKLAPENTLSAFRLGASHGYRMFECDAKLSKDGVLFMMHDSTLERTTNGHGTGSDKIMGEIAARYADAAIVTDDNPRSEDPAAIRAAILAGVKFLHDFENFADNLRRQSHRRLVQQHQRRARHQRPADGAHLLLAA